MPRQTLKDKNSNLDDDIRIVAIVPGRYSLDRFDSRGRRREYACRTLNMSSSAIALAVPVMGNPGERVLAHIDHFGKLKGTVGRPLAGGFILNLTATDDERANLSAKIAWFESHKNHDVSDQRDQGRIIPKNPHSSLLLSDGTILDCLVINISVDGAAVSADIDPEIGTVMAVGRVIGRVVRLFAGGFAIKFIAPQHKDRVEMYVTTGW